MIENERDYRTTRGRLERLEQYLASLVKTPQENRLSDPRWLKIERDNVRSIVDELRQDIAKYETARATGTSAAPDGIGRKAAEALPHDDEERVGTKETEAGAVP